MTSFKHDLWGRSSIPATVLEPRATVVVEERLKQLRASAHVLLMSPDPGIAGTGARLLVWLDKGGNLGKVLGVIGPRGRHRVRL